MVQLHCPPRPFSNIQVGEELRVWTAEVKTNLPAAALKIPLMQQGRIIGCRQGLIPAFILCLIWNMGSYRFSDKIVLPIYRARQPKSRQIPDYQIVPELAMRPRPRFPPFVFSFAQQSYQSSQSFSKIFCLTALDGQT